MSRLQKKCVIVSTGLHLLLLGIIVVGPAFTSSTAPEVREINFIPSIVVAENIAPGGGNPNAGRAPAPVVPPTQQPPQPPPQPRQEPRTRTEPEKAEPKKIEATDPNDWTTERKKKPEIVTKAQVRPKSTPRPRDNSAATEAEERRAADARRDLARTFSSIANDLREGAASATAIDGDPGPGGGGPAYAGYDSLVQMVYQNAWVKPSDTSKDAPVAYATVTIARDGSVVSGSARIITRSGDSQMDSSVQRVLDRVSTIGRPFPEGIKEKERTYKIRFDLTKRSLT